MKAHTIELNAGHLSLVSHPREVADLILEATGRNRQVERSADTNSVTK